MTITHADKGYDMQPINLHADHWSMLEYSDSSEPVTYITDISALADNISNTNTDDLCDFNNHEYTH